MIFIQYIAEGLKQILRMQSMTNIILKDLKQRVTKVEDALKNRNSDSHLENHNSLIADMLPLTTIESIQQFDELLKTTGEATLQFVSI